MAWDNEDNNSFSLYIYKSPCPQCNGDMVMVYEPYEEKSGTRICGHVCVECGYARRIDSQMFFPLYTGKYKRDEWVVDEDDLYDFHEDAQAIIRNMKSGRFFKLPRQRAPQSQRPSGTTKQVRTQPQRSSQSQWSSQPQRPSQNQRSSQNPWQEQSRRNAQSRQNDFSRQSQSGISRSPFAQQSGYQGGRQGAYTNPLPVIRSFIFVRDVDALFKSGDYYNTVKEYIGKIKAGFQLESQELFQYAYSLDELKMYKEAIAAWSEYIERFPKNSDIAIVYNNRGVAYASINDLDRSTADYRKAISLGYSDSEKLMRIINGREAQKRLDQAKRQYDAGNYSAALQGYEAVHRDGYDLTNHWFEYGYCLAKAERTKDAISAYTRYISLKPDSSVTYYNRGLLYKKIGEYIKYNEDYWSSFYREKDESEKTKILNSLYATNKANKDITLFEAVLAEKRRRNEADEVDAGKFFMALGYYQKAINCLSRSGTRESQELLLRYKVDYALARKAYREAFDYICGSREVWDLPLCQRVFSGMIEGQSDGRKREVVREAMESVIFSRLDVVKRLYEEYIKEDTRSEEDKYFEEDKYSEEAGYNEVSQNDDFGEIDLQEADENECRNAWDEEAELFFIM